MPNQSEVGNASLVKGYQLENEVAHWLDEAKIRYTRHVFLRGSSKKWNVDFREDETNTLIECKNVVGRNLSLYLEECCLKAIDLRKNLNSPLNFIVVIPNNRLPGSLVNFLTHYDIKIVTNLKAFIEAHKVNAGEVNVSCLHTPPSRADQILMLLRIEEGLNHIQIAQKLHMKWIREPLQKLEKKKLIIGISGRGRINGGTKRYYLRGKQRELS